MRPLIRTDLSRSRLNHECRRMRLCIHAGNALGRLDIASMAHRYLCKLDWLAVTTTVADDDYVAGVIGPNGIGPALDDVVQTVRIASKLAAMREHVRRAA